MCPDGFDALDGADHTGYIASNGAIIPVYKSEIIVRCRGRERPPPKDELEW